MSVQIGFDMDYTDPVTKTAVPWAKFSKTLYQTIKNARWKVVDTETTGLNPASNPQNFSGKELRRGVDPSLRVRVLTVKTSLHDKWAFDLDELLPNERKLMCEAAMTGMFVGHNASFDIRWLSGLTSQRPALAIDTMLLARALKPEHPVHLAHMCQDLSLPDEIRESAESVFREKSSGWSLEHVVLGFFGRQLDKGMQGPKNWCEPFLTQKHYDYATGDVDETHLVLCHLLGISPEEDPYEAYMELRAKNDVVRLVEPVVEDVCSMVEHGMPWSPERARIFLKNGAAQVKEMAAKLVSMEPALAEFEHELADPGKGTGEKLKHAIAKAFADRGLELERTSKSQLPKVGEKDLRKVKAEIAGPEVKELFEAWTGLNKAKKAMGMCEEVSGFAQRSDDKRIHSNTGPGPVTGRLASSEPNAQQFPALQLFRDCVEAGEGKLILGVDFSALDMRVGAALAIRAQEQILDAYMTQVCADEGALRCINTVMEGKLTVERALNVEKRANAALAAHMALSDEEKNSDRKKYWEAYRKHKRGALLSRFQRVLLQVRERALAAGEPYWGALRDAFRIPGMDIHTWTTLGMLGKDPSQMFKGLSPEDIKGTLKHWKSELGDQRKTGKVGNLSLLYYMQPKGLQDAAASKYNLHWTLPESTKIYSDWHETYLEIDLWHMWTELNPVDRVYIPDPEAGGEYRAKQVYRSETLAGRVIYAFGLNAALSYEDQSTGADILGKVMRRLREQHPPVFDCTVNQVHDELVLEVPEDRSEEYQEVVRVVMNDCANELLMPYGVPSDCSPALAKTWVKD